MNNLSNLGLRLPRYQQLAQSLAERIERGDYQVGSLIPGEENLCVEHKLSRYTVREALRHLQDIGLVEKRHGVGTAVMAKTPQRMFSHTIGSVEQLQQYARATRLTGHQMQMVTADKALAAEFSCAPGDRFLRIEAMRVPVGKGGTEPLACTCIHLVEQYAGIKTRIKSATRAIGNLIEEVYGERISAIEQQVSAVSIDAATARKLNVSAGSAGLRVDRVYLGTNGRPFEFVTAIHPGSRFSLSMRLDRAGRPL
jgi:GntR family transcriptional regulator